MPEQSPVRLTEAGGSIAATDGGSGRYRVLAISAGKGSSGVYPASTLREAADKRLIQGGATHVFLDHPSATEAQDRPERSVRDLAGVFTTDAVWDEAQQGLVAEMQVFAPYRDLIASMAEHVGLSIRGSGVMEAAADGARTVTSLDHIESVDFVTRAGRGGKVLSVLESARPTFDAADMAAIAGVPDDGLAATAVAEGLPAPDPTPEPSGVLVPELSEAEVTALRTTVAEAEAARDAALAEAATARTALAEATARATARPTVTAKVAESQTLGARTQARLVESIIAGLPVVDGAIDADALTAAVTEAVTTAEAEAAEYARPAPVAEAWGSFVPAARTEVAESDALTAYDTAAASIFGRKGA